jgi:hypothetical protein
MRICSLLKARKLTPSSCIKSRAWLRGLLQSIAGGVLRYNHLIFHNDDLIASYRFYAVDNVNTAPDESLAGETAIRSW